MLSRIAQCWQVPRRQARLLQGKGRVHVKVTQATREAANGAGLVWGETQGACTAAERHRQRCKHSHMLLQCAMCQATSMDHGKFCSRSATDQIGDEYNNRQGRWQVLPMRGLRPKSQ